MKQLLVYFGLFCGFTASMSGTRYLDSYVTSYEVCADAWKSAAKDVQVDNWRAVRFLEKLDEGVMIVDGAACPSLRPEHENILREQVISRSPTGTLRGLSNP